MLQKRAWQVEVGYNHVNNVVFDAIGIVYLKCLFCFVLFVCMPQLKGKQCLEVNEAIVTNMTDYFFNLRYIFAFRPGNFHGYRCCLC